MRSSFVNREYPEKLIDSEIRKTKFNTRETNRKNESENVYIYIYIYNRLSTPFFNGFQ